MRTSPSFGSESSFQGIDSSTIESFVDDNDEVMDWGVVSHTESDVGALGQTSSAGNTSEYYGVLICNGEESNPSNNSSDLSIPGTESLPSDIGSLSAGNDEQLHAPEPSRKNWAMNKRMMALGATMVIFVLSFITGFFLHQRNIYISSMEKLELKILQLEKEKEEIKVSNELPPPWMEEESDDIKSAGFFTLFDNCWIKAKMNVKFGECSENASASPYTLFGNAADAIGQWFDEVFQQSASDSTEENNKEQGKPFDRAAETAAAFHGLVGEAIASTSKILSEKMSTMNLQLEQSEDSVDELARASENLSNALHSAGDDMASELKDLGDDPVQYVTSAVKEASRTSKQDKVTMNGLFGAAKAVSSASLSWGEALVQTGEAFSVKVVEMMDDPLSFFDYENKASSDNNKSSDE